MSTNYQFIHNLLAEIALSSPPHLLRVLLEGAAAPMFIEEVWADLTGDTSGAPDVQWVPGEELSADVEGIAVVVMPEPESQTEAWFAAIVVGEGVRYFTLERGGRADETVLGGWYDDGVAHANFGPGPAPEMGAFVQAVVGLID